MSATEGERGEHADEEEPWLDAEGRILGGKRRDLDLPSKVIGAALQAIRDHEGDGQGNQAFENGLALAAHCVAALRLRVVDQAPHGKLGAWLREVADTYDSDVLPVDVLHAIAAEADFLEARLKEERGAAVVEATHLVCGWCPTSPVDRCDDGMWIHRFGGDVYQCSAFAIHEAAWKARMVP